MDELIGTLALRHALVHGTLVYGCSLSLQYLGTKLIKGIWNGFIPRKGNRGIWAP
jgi:hypothetical protein